MPRVNRLLLVSSDAQCSLFRTRGLSELNRFRWVRRVLPAEYRINRGRQTIKWRLQEARINVDPGRQASAPPPFMYNESFWRARSRHGLREDSQMQRRTFLGTLAAGAMCGSGATSLEARHGGSGTRPCGGLPGTLPKLKSDIELVGISEPDREVAERYVRRSRLDPATIFPSLEAMLEKARPQAVVAFTSTAGHSAVVAACASRKIPVMMEKPLAVGMEQARAIERAAAEGGIPVLVNYETTWYPSNHAAYALANGRASAGRDPQGRRPRRPSRAQGDRRTARVPRLAHRPGEERRRRSLRLRLLRRQLDDVAHGRRASGLRDRRDPADQARDLREG